ncbi:serine protease [Akkermansiaceae bacterium]|nr:serine protease [Akkermansiaceae bacterium]
MKFLSAVFLVLLTSCSEPKPAAAEPPTYQTLHPSNSKGTVFHFDHDGDLFLACSIHQGNNAPGTKLTRHGTEDFVTIGKQIHHQKDLRVLKFDSETIGEKTALPYHANPSVNQGDEVVILNRGKKIRGTVRQVPTSRDHHYYFETDKAFAADGMSGSPVFSMRLGTIVGVLQTANNKTKATIAGFELLEMP